MPVISGSQINKMLSFMESKEGHGYSQASRFGPSTYDCSGLVYEAALAAGVPLPRSDAIADLEAVWFSDANGAGVIHDQSKIQKGDILFFTGSDPDPVPG